MRFRDENARVHLFSRREKAALELLEAVKFGLRRLPDWLCLPVSRTTAHEFELDAGAHDRRLAVTYPTTADTAVEATATHTHIDEWADMPRPDRIFASLEPTFSAPGCTSLLVTTGNGPANPSAEYWRRCLAGGGPPSSALHPQPSLKQLASELRDYQLPDTNCVQDSVIALAIALEHAPEAQGFESARRIDGRLFRALNPPVSSRNPISTGIITWTPAN